MGWWVAEGIKESEKGEVAEEEEEVVVRMVVVGEKRSYVAAFCSISR